GPVAGDRQQHGGVLLDRFPDRVRAGEMQDHLVHLKDKLGGYHDRHVTAASSRDELPKPLGINEIPPLARFVRRIPRVDEHQRTRSTRPSSHTGSSDSATVPSARKTTYRSKERANHLS